MVSRFGGDVPVRWTMEPVDEGVLSRCVVLAAGKMRRRCSGTVVMEVKERGLGSSVDWSWK